jgi:hypothetical protein
VISRVTDFTRAARVASYVAPWAWATAFVCVVATQASSLLGDPVVAIWRNAVVIALLVGAAAHSIVVVHGLASRDFPIECRREMIRHLWAGGVYSFWRKSVGKERNALR